MTICIGFGFEEDGLNVRFDSILASRQGIKVAVGAFFNTERDVDVETLHSFLRISRCIRFAQHDKYTLILYIR